MSLETGQVLTHLRGARLMGDEAGWRDFVPNSAEPLTLKGVEIHYAVMEMPMADALAVLPPALHPSVPAHFTATFHRAPDSPVGPFEFAVIGVGCRAGVRPRMLTMSAFASSEQAAALLWQRSGLVCRVANVRTRSGYDGVKSHIEYGSETILEVATFDLEPVLGGGAAVKYCASLNPIRYHGSPALAQADLGYEYHETARGSLNVRAYSASRLAMPGGPPSFVICGVRSLVDLEFHPSRALYDLERQSEEGGMVKLAATARV